MYEATVDGRRVACKVTDCRKRTLAREGAVLAAVADGTPVPEPVEAGDGYLVVEWVDGEEYDREADRIEAAASGDVVGEE